MTSEELGDRFTVSEFIEDVEDGFLMDCDGHGKMFDMNNECLGNIDPSGIDRIHPDCVSVQWFNK